MRVRIRRFGRIPRQRRVGLTDSRQSYVAHGFADDVSIIVARPPRRPLPSSPMRRSTVPRTKQGAAQPVRLQRFPVIQAAACPSVRPFRGVSPSAGCPRLVSRCRLESGRIPHVIRPLLTPARSFRRFPDRNAPRSLVAPVVQVSPDKRVNFPCATAAFTFP